MTKILVTGGAGFIASHIASQLAENRDNFIVIVDNLSTGNLKKLPKSKYDNIKFIKCDVNVYRDISAVLLSYSFDYVFHFAAVVGVKRTLAKPVNVLNDISGIKNLLFLSKNTGVKRVFFSSSSEVYGEPFEIPQNEYTTPLNSRLPYAIVKNVGEAFLKSFKHEYGLDYTIFRFFNTYGPGQTTDFVMSRFVNAALKNRDVIIYGDGLQTRTFCYIKDSVEACLKAYYEDKYVNEVINIGNDDEMTIVDLAKIVIETTNSESKIIHSDALEEGDMTRRKPDNTKMRTLLDHDLLPLDKGIMIIIEYFKDLQSRKKDQVTVQPSVKADA